MCLCVPPLNEHRWDSQPAAFVHLLRNVLEAVRRCAEFILCFSFSSSSKRYQSLSKSLCLTDGTLIVPDSKQASFRRSLLLSRSLLFLQKSFRSPLYLIPSLFDLIPLCFFLPPSFLILPRHRSVTGLFVRQLPVQNG